MSFKRLTGFLVIFVFCFSFIAEANSRSCPGKRSFKRTKIIGGNPASMENWPGLVGFRAMHPKNGLMEYFCGGMRVSDQWIVTAAHCFDYVIEDKDGDYAFPHGGKLQVVRGKDDLKDVSEGDISGIEEIVLYPKYLKSGAVAHGHDIALVKIKERWRGETIPLALEGTVDFELANLRVAGYGVTSVKAGDEGKLTRFRDANNNTFWAGSSRLQDLIVPFISNEQCRTAHKHALIGEGQLCGGLSDKGGDSCQGDSGGPMIVYDGDDCPYQIGIVSWGEGCAIPDKYGVYTNIAHYSSWIKEHVENANTAAQAEIKEINLLATQQVFIERTKFHLKTLLGQDGFLNLRIRGGNKVRLGQEIVFEAESSVAGQLIIIDVNADWKVAQIFPNKHVADPKHWRIQAGKEITVPNSKQYGMSHFAAIEPVGKGQLLGIVVPLDFQLWASSPGQDLGTKGFQPVAKPTSYLRKILVEIEAYIKKRKSRGFRDVGEKARWAITVVKYEITQ